MHFREGVSLPGRAAHALEKQARADAGWVMDLEGGIITVSRVDVEEQTLVPIGNVAWAKRSAARAKKVA